ncbi:MAG: hypothetical protein ACXW1Z_20715 [Methylobacter sp.]
MTVKQRLIKLEAAFPVMPWLIVSVAVRPSLEQLAEIDSAQKSGRCVIVFIEQGDTLWTNRAYIKPPWEQE